MLTKKKFYLEPNDLDIYLSYREAECMTYFLKGYSNKEVAQIMQVSRRTIESYVLNMKYKFRSRSKVELIKKIMRTPFKEIVGDLTVS